MTKVFIGGSRRVTRLHPDVRRRIDKIIEQGFPILVRDANGADKAVQTYLFSRRYGKVDVFCSAGDCRNNVGEWPIKAASVPAGSRGFDFYAVKDDRMAEEASVGRVARSPSSTSSTSSSCTARPQATIAACSPGSHTAATGLPCSVRPPRAAGSPERPTGAGPFRAPSIPSLGFIIPSMGTKRVRRARDRSRGRGLADALFAKVQQRVLGVLFGNPGRSFYANEVIALAHSGTGAVQRELARLEAAGLVTAVRVGKQKHYQANQASPVFQELRALVLKTSGLADVLREALARASDRIRAAFVYGSIAKGEDTAASDIDLMIVSEGLTYADLFGALEAASAKLGRKVAPTIYSPPELARRVKQDNAFVTRVLEQPKLWLIGDERALAA